jgi:4-hydroxy-tetrahydrodipicolinate reductase
MTEVKTVKVAIAGINGRMGRASAKAMMSEPGFKVVGAFGRSGAGYVGKDIAHVAAVQGEDKTGILVSNGFLDSLAGAPDVLLEFTLAETAVENAKMALERGIRPVIGVSGITPKQIEELSKIAADKKLGAMVVPNFSVGAVLMMEFAKQAAAMFEHVEIVEMHHTGKHDAPSGTSMHTARKLALAEKTFNKMEVDETELLPGSRGGTADAGVRIHSLRLPGLISHQEVIFGADGELLTIRHDSFNTNCFLKGIFLAIRSVMQLDRLVVGLDSVLPLGSKN